MDWADKRVRTNFIHLQTQNAADMAVLAPTKSKVEQPMSVYDFDKPNAEWQEYLLQKGFFIFFSLQTGLCCYLLFFLGAPLMGPPDVVNNIMEKASRYIDTQVKAGDYTSFYADVFHRASASRKKRFSSSSSYYYYS